MKNSLCPSTSRNILSPSSSPVTSSYEQLCVIFLLPISPSRCLFREYLPRLSVCSVCVCLSILFLCTSVCLYSLLSTTVSLPTCVSAYISVGLLSSYLFLLIENLPLLSALFVFVCLSMSLHVCLFVCLPPFYLPLSYCLSFCASIFLSVLSLSHSFLTQKPFFLLSTCHTFLVSENARFVYLIM